MKVIFVDRNEAVRARFHPLTFCRPIWELRCGFSSLREKLLAGLGLSQAAYFVPDYMAQAYQEALDWPRGYPVHGMHGQDARATSVNDMAVLKGDDLLVLDGRLKAETLDVPHKGPSVVGVDDNGAVLYARITAADAARLDTADIDGFIASAVHLLPNVPAKQPRWNYTWDLILANPQVLAADFAAAGRCGIEGAVEQPTAIRGNRKDVYVAPGALVHPMVVIDAEHGPVYIDADAEIHPFTRIEGPCYVGPQSILLGAKCREGNSIGPMCRVGGEIEESIIHGYSNKYHDGFLGHAYVGQWVNLGALTTNSDLKNDYSSVSVMLDDKVGTDTGSPKVGALIGDHTKTSVGTLLNTGAYVGAMAIIMATGKPLPKHIPSFSWLIEGIITKGFGKRALYETAAVAMSRRKQQWTDAQQTLWDAVFEITAPARLRAVKKGRRELLNR